LTITDVLVRVQMRDGTVSTTLVRPNRPWIEIAAAPGLLAVAGAYVLHGIEHILFGFDHLLFVLALLIITRGPWRLVKTVTAFTVAHSVTLSLAALGIVHVPSAPVEAVIALSIVFVATEIVHGRQGRPGLTQRAPWLVAFAFGLLHGFGFAGALSEIGLPQLDIPLALFSFNVGVEIEIGQLLFIAAMLAMGCARTTAQATSGLSVACGVKESCTVCHRQRLGVLADPATGRVLRTGPVGAGKKSCCKIKVDVRIQVEAFAHRIDDRLSSTHSIE
jgi:hydrogenase/urease accessory protein HupE